jgi:hypothetical protein
MQQILNEETQFQKGFIFSNPNSKISQDWNKALKGSLESTSSILRREQDWNEFRLEFAPKQ